MLELWEKKLGSFSCLQWWHVLQVLEISGRISPFFGGLDFDQSQNDEGVTQKMGKFYFDVQVMGLI